MLYYLSIAMDDCRFIRDFAYDNVANNRYNIFGRTESCEI
jgi:predicted DCC family thiol-disulfide oxidoreductase YuxK